MALKALHGILGTEGTRKAYEALKQLFKDKGIDVARDSGLRQVICEGKVAWVLDKDEVEQGWKEKLQRESEVYIFPRCYEPYSSAAIIGEHVEGGLSTYCRVSTVYFNVSATNERDAHLIIPVDATHCSECQVFACWGIPFNVELFDDKERNLTLPSSSNEDRSKMSILNNREIEMHEAGENDIRRVSDKPGEMVVQLLRPAWRLTVAMRKRCYFLRVAFEGASVEGPHGVVLLDVPTGAVKPGDEVLIELEDMSNSLLATLEPFSVVPLVMFKPHYHHFLKPVTISFPHSIARLCSVEHLAVEKCRWNHLSRCTSKFSRASLDPSQLRIESYAQRITLMTDHFCTHRIASPCVEDSKMYPTVERHSSCSSGAHTQPVWLSLGEGD